MLGTSLYWSNGKRTVYHDVLVRDRYTYNEAHRQTWIRLSLDSDKKVFIYNHDKTVRPFSLVVITNFSKLYLRSFSVFYFFLTYSTSGERYFSLFQPKYDNENTYT